MAWAVVNRRRCRVVWHTRSGCIRVRAAPVPRGKSRGFCRPCARGHKRRPAVGFGYASCPQIAITWHGVNPASRTVKTDRIGFRAPARTQGSEGDSSGVTATSCAQATTPNVPTLPKRQPLLGQIYGLALSSAVRSFLSAALRSNATLSYERPLARHPLNAWPTSGVASACGSRRQRSTLSWRRRRSFTTSPWSAGTRTVSETRACGSSTLSRKANDVGGYFGEVC